MPNTDSAANLPGTKFSSSLIKAISGSISSRERFDSEDRDRRKGQGLRSYVALRLYVSRIAFVCIPFIDQATKLVRFEH